MPQIYKQFVKLETENLSVKTYTFVTISVAVIAVLLFFAIRPTILVIFEVNDKIAEYNDALTVLTSKNKALGAIKLQLDQNSPSGAKDSVSFLENESVPSKDDTLFMAANMSEIAKISKVELISFAPSATTDTDPSKLNLQKIPSNVKVKKVIMAINAPSTFEINIFLANFNGFARLTKVNDISIKTNPDTQNTKYPYIATIDFLIFYT